MVTVAQVLATAAVLDGLQVRALDQTGLAQKGGAVVSDLTITAAEEPAASRLTDGACDLYLGCDSLVATDGRNLAVADREPDPGRRVDRAGSHRGHGGRSRDELPDRGPGAQRGPRGDSPGPLPGRGRRGERGIG